LGTRLKQTILSRPWLSGAASLLAPRLLCHAGHAMRHSRRPWTTRMSVSMQLQEVGGHKAGADCFELTLARQCYVAPCASASLSCRACYAPFSEAMDHVCVCEHAASGSWRAQGRSRPFCADLGLAVLCRSLRLGFSIMQSMLCAGLRGHGSCACL
jgi:hypothetical protein